LDKELLPGLTKDRQMPYKMRHFNVVFVLSALNHGTSTSEEQPAKCRLVISDLSFNALATACKGVVKTTIEFTFS
jgi:predicted rRNA methylase YqxC with S4 and FtsJ domains